MSPPALSAAAAAPPLSTRPARSPRTATVPLFEQICAEGWAPRLLAATQRLTTPAHLPAAMPAHAQVLRRIEAMFRRFSAEELPRVRSWVNGGQRYTITDDLVRLAGQPMPLPQRLAAASGAEQYCVTFNGLSAWCPEFAEEMQREMLAPLFAELGGAPRAGCDFYTFIGNYGYTPFGVHDDVDHSLLWHLGPGKKTAYVWPRAEYQALTGGTLATTEYQHLLPHARRYELSPGDLLCIPLGDFHVLETRELSATLGLTLFPDDPMLECAEGLRMVAPDAATLGLVGEQPLTLDELRRLRQLALESNGASISAPSLRVLAHSAPAPETLEDLAASTISCRPGYPLRAIRVAGREGLLVRRRVIWARPTGIFPRLVEALAGAERLPFARLAAQFTGTIAGPMSGVSGSAAEGATSEAARPMLRPDALLELLRKLHQMGGIVLERG